MIKPKKNKCRGTGPAKGVGCGELVYRMRYGLGACCINKFYLETEEGRDVMAKTTIRAKNKTAKEYKKKRTQEKKDNKSTQKRIGELQTEINTIARLIDIDKGCISCNHGWGSEWTRQAHGGHRLSVGDQPALRFNLFNIYKQCSICNNHKSSNPREYDRGLKKHYNLAALVRAKNLKAQYPLLKLPRYRVEESLIISRRIIREIKAGKDYSRELVNKLLAIYE